MTVLTASTLVVLFIAVLTALLAVPAVVLSLNVYRRTGRNLSEEERDLFADRSQLLLLISGILLAIKLPAWPMFYFALHSLIPSVQGAMCIFGVAETKPFLSGVLQALKPLLFFLMGAWLVLQRLNRDAETSAFFRAKHLFLFIISLFIILDSGLDIFYFTTVETGSEVACCTTVFDIAEGKNASLTTSLIGRGWDRPLLLLLFTMNALLAVFFGYVFRQLKRGREAPLAATGTGAALAALNGIITVAALFEVVAPAILDLQGHHCIYCMWQYALFSIIMTGSFIGGTYTAGWMHAVNIAVKRFPGNGPATERMQGLARLGIGCILFSSAIAACYLFL